MADRHVVYESLGVGIPDVCLPAPGVDWASWAVVACDQYSSERAYWDEVRALVGDRPSTLNLVFPECYLEDADKAERVTRIQSAMRDYLERGVVRETGPGFVLVERYTPFEKRPRKGLVISVDLEKYVYGKDSRSLIRPTEGTIVERLPPRMQIRRGAPLELPHIMLLIDDPGRTVIEPLYAARESLPALYDFDLMKGAGRARGWHVRSDAALDAVAAALEKLASPSDFEGKYGSKDVLLFAVGDGNHSLATAKAVWEEIKAQGAGDPGIMSHPARYALVELVNIYDEGLPFHPIHRVLFNADAELFLRELGERERTKIERFASAKEALAFVDAPSGAEHRIALLSKDAALAIRFVAPTHNLAAGTVQDFVDAYIKRHADTGIDYIHGTESTLQLGTQPGNLALYLPPIDKSGFFATVIKDGVMPRKTFSMGEAPEKRFYVEARRITR